MRFFLTNIAEKSLLRTGILLVLGGLFWIPSLLSDNGVVSVANSNIEEISQVAVWVTLALTLLNSILFIHLFYKGKETTLPSSFVGVSYWFAMSATPLIHSCWQAQFVIAGVLLASIVLLQMDFQHDATEESFLATLICCVVAIHPSILITGIMMLWGYLIIKHQMSWRVWFASLIAIAIRIITMTILHYFGWLEMIWMENIPQLTGMQWLVCAFLFCIISLMILLPIRKPSVGSGVVYSILIILLTAVNVVWNIQNVFQMF